MDPCLQTRGAAGGGQGPCRPGDPAQRAVGLAGTQRRPKARGPFPGSLSGLRARTWMLARVERNSASAFTVLAFALPTCPSASRSPNRPPISGARPGAGERSRLGTRLGTWRSGRRSDGDGDGDRRGPGLPDEDPQRPSLCLSPGLGVGSASDLSAQPAPGLGFA